RDYPITSQYIVDQEPVHASIAIGQGMDVDKAERSHCTTHHRRLSLRSFKKDTQSIEHRRNILGNRGHVMHHLLVAHYLTHEYRRLPYPETHKRGPLTKDLALQFGQRRIGQRPFALASASCHHVRKTLDTGHLISLSFNG